MQRIPVVGPDGQPLMPTTPQRARRWLEAGKAIKRWSDVGVFYVQRVNRPTRTDTQPIVIGIDPGKHYSGIGVQSARFTLLTAHLILPFKQVKERMETRAMMRRTRRARRINRDVEFKFRNHRQKRFDNRKSKKVPPSIKANRQLELRVVTELAAIYPVSGIVYEYVKARGNKGFSPVMVGQRWMLEQLEKIAPTTTIEGWKTSNIRHYLGLTKSKDKSAQTPESHAVDGIALAASEFIAYERYQTQQTRGAAWVGEVTVTNAPFKVIRRPPIRRRQLHLLQPRKGGVRRKYGGTITRHGFRKGDYVQAEKAGMVYYGWVSGDTARQVSVSDLNWKRLGQFASSKVTFIQRNTGLLVNGALNPAA
ncbi:MAG: RRXRR domain-containing protein [Leptolyngbyaceae cyanobacterium]